MSNVVIGLSVDKNGYSSTHPLDLTGLRDLVVVDVDYFKAHMAEVASAVLGRSKGRQKAA